ncbi:MAG: DMT family transporter [Acidobacteriota bacterium]
MNTSAVRGGVRSMVASAFWFSVMSALVKVAGERLPSQEIVLARAIVSLVLSYALVRRAGVSPWGNQPAWLLLRGLCGFLGLTCFYYAVTQLPLAETTVIQYLHPMLTALFAAWFLGEVVRSSLVFSLALSLVGVLAVARPSFLFGAAAADLPPLALAAAGGGALFSAFAYVLVRRLSGSEHSMVIILYFPLVTVPLALPWVWQHGVWPHGFEWLILLGVGIATQLGQVYLTRGIRLLPAGKATSLSYLQVAFAGLWGMLFFAEVPDGWFFVGAALILAGAFVSARSR